MKMKHNKKRNTAFLYESLLKELTKAIIREQVAKKRKIIQILKEFFYKNSPLDQDLEVYKSLLECKKMSKEFAHRFLTETKKDYDNLDRKAIFNAQTKLIKVINESLSSSAFANFLSNYKEIASVGAFFDSKMKAKNRLLIETKLVNRLTKDKPSYKEMKHIDNLSYRTFVNKFNETYDKTLRKEQKDLLTNYIISFSDNGLGLKSFMNEEISRLKNEIGKVMIIEEKSKNNTLSLKLERVLGKLNDFSKQKITEEMVKDVFYIQDLLQEVKN